MYSDSELSQVRSLTFGLAASSRSQSMNGGIDYLEERNMTLMTLNGSILRMKDIQSTISLLWR